MKHYGDIKTLSGYELPIVDVITGGSPCQDLSHANANRKGLEGERSGLFYEQIRIVKEMRDASRRTDKYIRPRYMVWENVPGSLSSNNGKDFQAVLTEIARIVRPDAPDVPLPERGGWPRAGCLMGHGIDGQPFSIAWRIHDAQFWGVAQRRRRVSVVGDFGGLSAPEVLFERKGMYGGAPQKQEKRETTSKDVGRSSDSAIYGREVNNAVNTSDRSLVLNDQGGSQMDISYGVSSTLRAESHGHEPIVVEKQDAVFLDFSHANHVFLESDMVGSLQNRDYKGGKCVLVNEPKMIEMTSTKNTIVENGISPTLTARMGTGGNQVNAVLDKTADGTLQAKPNGGQSIDYSNTVRKGSTVRRLTPKECERLQGFPDDWTNIGEWVDTKGKKHKDADSPRYKALGNSIATPFWFYLLRRISAQYERPATLGSLFDGIGGFPYCWVRCNGTGSVLWTSEIDEFCIAVSKKHFGKDGDIQKYL